MGKDLTKIVSDLFARTADNRDLSSRVRQLGDEIRSVVQNEQTTLGKFRVLLESFREIIPDEKQRYQAALKALSTTSKLSRQEIIKAISSQREELVKLEKNLAPAQNSWRSEVKSMESRSQELKGEIAKLRDRITQLEIEEKAVRSSIAAREKDLGLAEKSVTELFATIGAEIASLNKKVEEFTAESAPPPPPPPPVKPAPQKAPLKPAEPIKNKKEAEQKVELKAEPAPKDSKFERKCPMCGGRFNLLEFENMWQCFTCGYEEPQADAPQGTGGEKGGRMSATAPAQTGGPIFDPAAFKAKRGTFEAEESDEPKRDSASTDRQLPSKSKDCPVCGKTMYWYPDEKAWRCPTCMYERRI